ncbi:hypothetical protein ASE66_28030 [Bosea sp. Root483D1]|uniref:hypothetical protein n=1 Tax=Bosea sp. Root483D1 TaxID=1736544 RepID=UPI00070D8B15|nr:hypothetical protein [Bosea sp. Root483D1]KRE21701.1 hypothetical protein ASE66_28030 [Bosea sp. Root483D1]
MTRTITRRYASFEDARNVVVRLSDKGIPADRIGLVGRQETGEDSTVAAAGLGGAAGAATGFVLSIGALSLPGAGAVIAAGWLLGGAAAGALAGGIAGALMDVGVAESEAERHAEAVKAGSAVVAVQAELPEVSEVEAIMDAGLPIAEEPIEPGGRDDPRDLSKAVS